MNDDFYMRCAVAVGEKARLLSPPNPWVGCILVKNGQIIAEGYTQPPGQAHAEVRALAAAKGQAEGATAYVTLEPCGHYGKTPPCTKALIEAKVARVVVALQDPDPLVSGKGIALLQQAGIEVTLGVCSKEAKSSLRAYLHHRTTGRAYCLVKTAISIDGRVAAKDGTSQWITCKEARRDAHHLRAASQAIMVGSGTALTDNPKLTVRDAQPPLVSPLRVLYDRRGRVPSGHHLFNTSLAPTLVITTEACPLKRRQEWESLGAIVNVVESEAPFDSVLSFLGSKGIIQLMVEGGPALQSSILRQRACQELVTYVGAVILGSDGVPAFDGFGISTISEAECMTLRSAVKVGNTTRIDYHINQD